MHSDIRTLLTDKAPEIFANSPSALVIIVDQVGAWDFADFEVVYFNKAAGQMMPKEVTETVVVPSGATMNALQGAWLTVKHSVVAGKLGFVGPFPYTTLNTKGYTLHLEFSALYLGELASKKAFMVITHDKSAEVRASCSLGVKHTLAALSPQEQRIAILICEKRSTFEIADRLCISERTVDNHRANIRRKLGLKGARQSIADHLSSL